MIFEVDGIMKSIHHFKFNTSVSQSNTIGKFRGIPVQRDGKSVRNFHLVSLRGS